MAQFNPAPQNQDVPSFLNYSKGQEADTSLGSLFTNTGNLIEQTMKNTNSVIVTRMGAEATAAYDEANTMYNVDDVTKAFSPDGTTPPEVERAYGQAKDLTTAVQNGTISSISYWAKMDAVARQLRARYPGHREEIDNKISGLTGSNPANKIRDLLFAKSTEGNTAEKERQSQLNKARDLGLTAPHVDELNGKGWSTNQLRLANAQQEAIVKKLELNKAQLSVEDAKRSSMQNTAYDNASNSMSLMVGAVWQDAGMTKLNDRINDMVRNGDQPSVKDIGEIEAQGRIILNTLRTNLMKHLTDPSIDTPNGKTSYQAILGAKTQEIVNTAIKPVEDALNYAKSGQLGFYQLATAKLEASKNQDVAAVRAADDAWRSLQAVQTIAGGQTAAWYATQNSAVFGNVAKSLSKDAVGRAIVNGDPLSDSFYKMRVNKVDEPAAYKEAIDKSIYAITDTRLPIEARFKALDAVFGEKNREFLSARNMSPSSFPVVFQQMTNPAVAQKMYDAGKEDPRFWEQYKNWVAGSFRIVNGSNVAQVQQVIENRDNMTVTIGKDGKLAFMPYVDPDAKVGLNWTQAKIADVYQNYLTSVDRKAIDELNRNIEPILKIQQMEGKDPQKWMVNFWGSGRGLNFNAPKTEGGLVQFFKAINSKTGQPAQSRFNFSGNYDGQHSPKPFTDRAPQ